MGENLELLIWLAMTRYVTCNYTMLYSFLRLLSFANLYQMHEQEILTSPPSIHSLSSFARPSS